MSRRRESRQFRVASLSLPPVCSKAKERKELTLQEPSTAGSSVLLSQTSSVNSDELRLPLFLENVEVSLKNDVGRLERRILVEETKVDDEMGEKSEERRVETAR